MSERPTITPRENGPFVVTDCPTLKGMLDGKEYATEGTVVLCRCGGSKNKPFCDGTHAKNRFTSAKADDWVPDKREDYVGQGVTVHDNRGVCAHAARCTGALKTVFKFGEEPWIDPDGDSAAQIAAAVEQCPSGALSYTTDGVEHRDRDAEPLVLIVPNGPYSVKGGATLDGGRGMG